jgi:hypothetical protein
MSGNSPPGSQFGGGGGGGPSESSLFTVAEVLTPPSSMLSLRQGLGEIGGSASTGPLGPSGLVASKDSIAMELKSMELRWVGGGRRRKRGGGVVSSSFVLSAGDESLV